MTTRQEGPLARTCTPGPALYRHSVFPDQKPAAIVGVIHGYADHGARYAHVMDAWAERGIASVAIDLRGHGRSGGRRGYCERFAEYGDDVQELERAVAEEHVPAFLFGHSLGGLVAASSALANPAAWRALVVSAPLFGIAVDVSPLKRLAGEIASRLVPTFALPSGLRGADVTHDTAIARAYDADPLVFHTATARWFTEVKAAQERTMAAAGSLQMPLYAVMGTADHVAKVEAARAFFDRAGSRDKTWDAREGLFHEVLNEPVWPSIAAAMADFVLARR